jgi:hypothetical protein
MKAERFVAYYRVSTQAQARSGLGLDAQREAVERLAEELRGMIIAQSTEAESGTINCRPETHEGAALRQGHGRHRAHCETGSLEPATPRSY